eukprot:scaffold54436_cov72-Phaeocystis_antarctica.AAC.4
MCTVCNARDASCSATPPLVPPGSARRQLFERNRGVSSSSARWTPTRSSCASLRCNRRRPHTHTATYYCMHAAVRGMEYTFT